MLKKGDYSPWGPIQHVKSIREGIESACTAGHGGLKLSKERNAQIPESMRRAGGWYEEDSEWCIPWVVLKIGAPWSDTALTTLKDDYPDYYEELTGKVLKPGESRTKDERAWHAKHRDDYQVYSVVGSWHDECPEGFVLAWVAKGGRIVDQHGASRPGPDRRRFLIPKEVYDNRGKFGFVVDDTTKYTEVKFTCDFCHTSGNFL